MGVLTWNSEVVVSSRELSKSSIESLEKERASACGLNSTARGASERTTWPSVTREASAKRILRVLWAL